MTNNLTLIESEVLDELLEKAFLYDILSETNQLMYETDWAEVNKQVMVKKNHFLSNYVNVPLVDLNGTIEEGLERLGYE